MFQSFHHTDVCIVELDIFAYQSHCNIGVGAFQVVHHFTPVFQIRLRTVQMETFADNLGKMLFFHCKRRFVQIFHIQILKNMLCRDITEQSDLVLDGLIQRVFGTK